MVVRSHIMYMSGMNTVILTMNVYMLMQSAELQNQQRNTDKDQDYKSGVTHPINYTLIVVVLTRPSLAQYEMSLKGACISNMNESEAIAGSVHDGKDENHREARRLKDD
jgi:hypothetical protein